MPGLREGLIGLIVLVALYMAFMLWRMRTLRRRKAQKAAPPMPQPLSAEDPPPVVPGYADHALEAAPDDAWAAAELAAASVPGASLDDDVRLLREEVEILRGELAALREDMQQELGHLRATQSVSPIYGDAMQMAAAGYEAAMIAERCGIARAEAELVVALSKSRLSEGE